MVVSRDRSSASRLSVALAAIAAAGTSQIAYAGDDAGHVDGDEAPTTAVRSVESGAFLSSALTARSDDRQGFVAITGGWNDSRGGSVYDVSAEARLLGPVSLRAGAFYDGPGTTASPHAELRLDTLKQTTHGVDLAFAAGYADTGINMVPAATLKAAVGRNIGASYVLGNAAYNQGLEEDERSGELRLAALYPVSASAHVGVDSRFQIDLERDDDEPEGETDWEWRSGLVASYVWNRIVFTGTGGVSALRMRAGGPTEVGPLVTGGFGTIF